MTDISTNSITNAIRERRDIITNKLCDFLPTDLAKLTSMYDYYLAGKVHMLKGHRGGVWCIDVLPNGKIVSGSADCTIRIWDPETGNCEKILHHSYRVRCIIILSNEYIITGCSGCILRVWNLENDNSALIGVHNSIIICCAKISNDTVVSGSSCGEIKIWRLSYIDHKKEYIGGKLIKTFKNDDPVFSIIHLHDKKIVSGDYAGQIKLWDYGQESNECISTRYELGAVHSLISLSSGRAPLDGAELKTREGQIIGAFYNEYSIKIINFINGLSENLNVSYSCFDLLPDGRLIGCSSGKYIKICNINNNKKFNLIKNNFTSFNTHCCKVLTDGRVVFGLLDNCRDEKDEDYYLFLVT